MTDLGALSPQSPQEAGSVTDLDVLDLLAKSKEILRREISNLMIESSSKKLSPNSSRDLVSYLRLLNELKADDEAKLSEMTDEELLELKNP